MSARSSWLAVVLSVFIPAWAVSPGRAADPPSREHLEFFEQKIRPVLVEQCYSCHSEDAKKLRGDLLLDSREGIARGGASGPVLNREKPKESLLLQSIRHDEDVAAMPPKGAKLSAEVIADFERWVQLGAPDPRSTGPVKTTRLDLEQAKEFWSFRPLVRPAVPELSGPLVHNPIDSFIQSQLAAKGLKPSPPASKRVLIRRVYFDLVGLPPSPEAIDEFVSDDSPDAYERLIDRLLASKAYGERWGRHWMDVIRYADTAGDNSDYPIPQMYRYRNWIIDAFNQDMPYDEFIRQQIAGDLLPSDDEADRQSKLIATGYLANTKRFGSYEDARYPWYLTYEDQIDNLGRTFLGLTINCTRCHDHKFDPLSQEDYYALYGFFSSTRYPRPGIELDKVQRDFVPLATADVVAKVERERAQRQQELDQKVKDQVAERKAREQELAEAEKLPDSPDKAKTIEGLNKKIDNLKGQIKTAQKASEEFARTPLPYDTAYAVAEATPKGPRKVGDAAVHIKGDPERVGPVVPRRFPEVLGGYTLPKDEPGSGRVHLANWLADAKNPLTARVMVNRIWHYHFGRGIVATPSDFGLMGLPPTDPELLDWLASEFIAQGWSIKQMHKLILMSHTYQQGSQEHEAGLQADVQNESLWRFPRRRLDAEAIRDTMLLLADQLDREPAEAHPFPEPKTWNFTQHRPFHAVYETNKRSVYLMTQRFQRHPYLAIFDGPDTNASTASRVVSTTPLQALYLMNDPFVHDQARRFGERLRREASTEPARVQRAYQLVYGRSPTDDEARQAVEWIEEVQKLKGEAEAWPSFVRALFLSNEFVYID